MNVMDSLKEENYFSKAKPLIIFMLIAIIGITWQFFARKKIAEEGIYTKCILVNVEGYKGGVLLTIKYTFNGKDYEGMVHGALGKLSIGKQFFVKLLPYKPAAPLLLEDNPVPDCLTNAEPPQGGWKDMPGCK